jgi:nucleotidyltransferase/DNA polymerase involved in DNA repair
VAAAEMARDRAQSRQHQLDIKVKPTGQHFMAAIALTDSAMAIAASYAARVFGIKTGTLVRDARRLCPAVITVEANHRRYTDYHERILKAVDTCLPVEKVCSIDEMACRLMGTERQPAAARLALNDPPLGGPPQALGNSRQGTCRCIGAHKSRREIAERLPLCDKSSV